MASTFTRKRKREANVSDVLTERNAQVNVLRRIKNKDKATRNRVAFVISELSVKAVSANEFTDDACGGDFILNVSFSYVVEKSNHCTHLFIAFITRINLGEKGIDILLNLYPMDENTRSPS